MTPATRAQPRTGLEPCAPAAPPFYVPIPHRLTTDLYDTPLAIGVYALVARLHQVARAPVPLSVPDVMRYDPTTSRGALIRALDRLLGSGYLIAHGTGRQKRTYTPAWGRVHGVPLAWDLAAPCLGRPRHIHALRLDQRLLDTCMGKLALHPMRAATVTRYLTAPLLALADLGTYALALAGIPRATPALERLGLIEAGAPLPLMSDERLLALASQQTLKGEAALTASGARKLGMVPILPPAADSAQPLFFVPPQLIGDLIQPMIGPLIGRGDDQEVAASTPGLGKPGPCYARTGITWMDMDYMDSEIPPLSPPRAAGGGGRQQAGDSSWAPGRVAWRRADAQLPSTRAALALRAINVRPEVVAELAGVPLATVELAIADARSRPYVRDVAAWAVALIRATRDHGFQIAPPAPPPGADIAEAWRAYLAREAIPEDTSDDADTVVAATVDELPCVIRRELRWRADRALRPLVDQIEIRVLDDIVRLICRQGAQIPTVQTQLLPIVRAILPDLDVVGARRSVVVAAEAAGRAG